MVAAAPDEGCTKSGSKDSTCSRSRCPLARARPVALGHRVCTACSQAGAPHQVSQGGATCSLKYWGAFTLPTCAQQSSGRGTRVIVRVVRGHGHARFLLQAGQARQAAQASKCGRQMRCWVGAVVPGRHLGRDGSSEGYAPAGSGTRAPAPASSLTWPPRSRRAPSPSRSSALRV